MANIKIIDLSTGSPESNSYIEATQVDSQAASGRSSVKVNMAELGNWIAGQGNSPLEYNDLKTEDDTPIGAINELHDSIGADVYDTNTSYTAGMYCIYNNTLYRCKASTSGAWDSSKWEAKTITSLIESKANSSDVTTALATKATYEDITSTVSFGTDINSSGSYKYIVKIGKIVYIYANLQPKENWSGGTRILLSNLPARAEYQESNYIPVVVNNQYFNGTTSTVLGSAVNGSNQLQMQNANATTSNRIYINGFYRIA